MWACARYGYRQMKQDGGFDSRKTVLPCAWEWTINLSRSPGNKTLIMQISVQCANQMLLSSLMFSAAPIPLQVEHRWAVVGRAISVCKTIQCSTKCWWIYGWSLTWATGAASHSIPLLHFLKEVNHFFYFWTVIRCKVQAKNPLSTLHNWPRYDLNRKIPIVIFVFLCVTWFAFSLQLSMKLPNVCLWQDPREILPSAGIRRKVVKVLRALHSPLGGQVLNSFLPRFKRLWEISLFCVTSNETYVEFWGGVCKHNQYEKAISHMCTCLKMLS